MQLTNKQKTIAHYYSRPGSRIGYALLMRQAQHFSYYDQNHTNEWAAQKNYHQKFLKLLDLKPGMHVLDAGCGAGVVAAYVAQHADVTVTGVTLTPKEVQIAQRIARKRGLSTRVQFMQMDYIHTSFPDATFDRIYGIETLCHAPNIQAAIQEFQRLLKPGGKLLLAEYEIDLEKFGDDEREALDILADAAGGYGIQQMGLRAFDTYFTKAGLRAVREEDWTQSIYPSVARLARFATPLIPLVRRFHIERKLINVVIAYAYDQAIRKQEFFYKVFVAVKPVKD